MEKLTLPKLGLHSTTDWDFYQNLGGTWVLDPTTFVTPPSSLYLLNHSTDGIWSQVAMICNLLPTLNLKEGRMISQVKRMHYVWEGYDYTGFAIGFKSLDDYYIAPVFTSIGAWQNARVTWWNSYDLMNNPKLAIRVDEWNGAAWVEGTITYQNRLEGDINRCGLVVKCHTPSMGPVNGHFDDTEIWI